MLCAPVFIFASVFRTHFISEFMLFFFTRKRTKHEYFVRYENGRQRFLGAQSINSERACIKSNRRVSPMCSFLAQTQNVKRQEREREYKISPSHSTTTVHRSRLEWKCSTYFCIQLLRAAWTCSTGVCYKNHSWSACDNAWGWTDVACS